MNIADFSATQLSSMIKKRELSVSEVTNAVLDNISARDKDINAYITIAAEKALLRSKEVQKLLDKGFLKDSPLAGVPVSLKDNICTQGIRTTCASRMLENFIPPYNAHVTELLESAGAIILGKLNMDEFAMGSTSETSFFGAVTNPWNKDYTPGGSSGGCAAAIASGEAALTLGSDTGGSIRQPAAMCGVTGFKPSYGVVSRYGLIAYASSMDQIGPIARSAEDCSACMNVISGYDPKDNTSLKSTLASFPLNKDLSGVKIGIPYEYFDNNLSSEVRKEIYNALEILKSLGADISEFSLPISEYAIAAYYIIASAEASSNLARYDGIRYGHRNNSSDNLEDIYIKSRSEGFGSEVKNRIMLGTFALSAGYYDEYYKKALTARETIKKTFDDAFSKYDMIISPVSPSTAPQKGKSLSDPMKMYLSDAYTVSVNLAGLPAISLPCGFDSNGLPIGFQLIGPELHDHKLLNIGQIFQKHTNFHKKVPGGEKA
jgi:aspartyl-tRNA(Asn)/glutamyl-tRNA(Gln) amidotransferase subunit A